MCTELHQQTDGQINGMSSSMEQYLLEYVNHQPNDWVQWLPVAEFAANNGLSKSTKCTLCFRVQGADPQMSFAGNSTQERDQRRLDANQGQATLQHVYEHW
jgi:hypothetical protein